VHAQLSSSDETLAFISCPTAYVGFQHAYDRGNTYLLEYDTRFALLSEQEFVRYDLDEPLALPEGLKGKVDFMVVDPPFLNEVRWTQHATRCTSSRRRTCRRRAARWRRACRRCWRRTDACCC
jgi:hypothetical protein